MSDHISSLELLEALVPGCTEAKSIIIEGPPPSKARARFTKRGGAYHPGENRQAEQRTAWHLKRISPQPMTGNIALACIFFRPNRQRLDLDNLLKHVCDAATGVVWIDDSQVTAVAGILELDAIRPRSVITFARHQSSLVRDLGRAVKCVLCGKEFQKKGSKPQLMCSRACQLEAMAGRNRSAGFLVKTPCEVCGAPTSRPGVKKCRPCWLSRYEPAHSQRAAIIGER